MKDWFYAFLKARGPEIYDRLQELRTDYGAAMTALRTCANDVAWVKPSPLRVLDVACGTAIAARRACGDWRADRATIVGLDYDDGLLETAQRLLPRLMVERADMVKARLRTKFDLILCSFAYHHAEDEHKAALCRNLRQWSAADADVLVLEIALRPQDVKRYYDQQIRELHNSADRELGRAFLEWTMSDDKAATGEWKVPMGRILADFDAAGFALVDQKKIWSPAGLPRDAGCHLLHFKPENGRLQRQRQLGRAPIS